MKRRASRLTRLERDTTSFGYLSAHRVRMRSVFWAALIFGWSWLGNAHAAAADANAVATPRESAEDESRVRLKFVLPLWLPLLALNSSATVEGSQTEVVEAETEVSWIVIGMLDVGYRPFVARVDVFGVGFGETLSLKGGGERQIAFDGSGFVGRAILMYELGPWALNRTRTNRFLVAPLAGARYNQVKFEAAEASDLNGRYRWVDPVVGVRTEFTLGDFRLGTHIDFGGFGASSDLAFWGALTAEYFITNWFSIWLGWQHYQVHFEETSDRGEEQLGLYLTGPSAGFGLSVF